MVWVRVLAVTAGVADGLRDLVIRQRRHPGIVFSREHDERPGGAEIVLRVPAGWHRRVHGGEPEALAFDVYQRAKIGAGLIAPARGHDEGNITDALHFGGERTNRGEQREPEYETQHG